MSKKACTHKLARDVIAILKKNAAEGTPQAVQIENAIRKENGNGMGASASKPNEFEYCPSLEGEIAVILEVKPELYPYIRSLGIGKTGENQGATNSAPKETMQIKFFPKIMLANNKTRSPNKPPNGEDTNEPGVTSAPGSDQGASQ